MSEILSAGDLFCGGGGSSTGLVEACQEVGRKIDLVAVNHWKTAVETHRANHPWARHYLSEIRSVDPRQAVPSGHLDILLAGAPCPHFSLARGGRPMNRRERATPRQILRWYKDLSVDGGVVENVPEFRSWCRLDSKGYPDKRRSGEYYRQFIGRLVDMGYTVEDRVLNAADYGAATTRKRLFIMIKKGRIRWPEPTHDETTWRAAREIIDWSLQGESIFNRKKALAKNTLRRIAVGIERFCGEWAQPFLCMLYGTGTARSVDRPLPTVMSGGGRGGGHIALCQFILQQQSGGVAREVSKPVPTIAASGAQSLTEACLVPFYGERNGQTPRTHSIDEPVPTIPASGNGKFAKVDFIVKYFGTGIPHSVEEPAPTITTKDRIGLVQCHGSQYKLDIRFRMLQPHELARAMSFPEGYVFVGNRGDQIRQIGNAWDISLGRALCRSLLSS